MWLLLFVSMFLTDGERIPVDSFTLFDFSNPSHARWWDITNDDVMGGVSDGIWDIEEEYSVFSGSVSLDNNGGFSSVRAQFSPLDLSSVDGIQLLVRGDGQRYSFNLRDVHSWVSYRITFETDVIEYDEWQQILIPFEDLTPTRFGNQIPNADPIDLTQVWFMSILISDKQEGDFRLAISDLSVYREKSEVDQFSISLEPRLKI